MREAIVRDFSAIPGVEVVVCYDSRLPEPQGARILIPVEIGTNPWELWAECFASADALLLIAPETEGVLTRLTQLASQYDATLLGSYERAVGITSSKSFTAEILIAAGIPTIACYRWPDMPSIDSNAYVAKRDDGAGCEDSAYFESRADLDGWMQTRKLSHIVQPYLPGIAASISILCKDGQAWLLSCNRQKIELDASQFAYSGSILNDLHEYRQQFMEIANQIAIAIPGLFGYVGIDLIVNGDEMHVLEINPRLTTSYVGMHEATGLNPARLILDLAYNDAFVMPQLAYNRIEISLYE